MVNEKECAMKRRLNEVFVMYLVFMLAGCASIIQNRLDNYMGKDILMAHKQFGFNPTVRKLIDGNTVYTWIKSRSARWNHQGMGGISTNKCVISLMANSTGKIISTQFRDTHSANMTCYKHID